MNDDHSLLIVEDDEDLREILQRAFTRRGFRVSVCDGPDESLRLTREQPFQAAVIDGNLRGRDGIHLVRQLIELQPALRVIVLSGRADQAATERARRTPRLAYLPKPCSLADLRAAIDRALSEKPSAQAPSDWEKSLAPAETPVAAHP